MSESLSDAVREAAAKEAERNVAAVREECGWASDDAAWYRHGFAQGAVWVAGRLPSREAMLGQVQREMGCDERAHYGNVEQPYCGEHGGYGIWPCRESAGVVDAVLALIREHVTRG